METAGVKFFQILSFFSLADFSAWRYFSGPPVTYHSDSSIIARF